MVGRRKEGIEGEMVGRERRGRGLVGCQDVT